MPTIIPQTYYLDAPTLGSATCIFTDSTLSICAPDGFYSDGVITRQLIGCILLPQQPCPTCGIPCGGAISGSGGTGVYLLDIDTGTTPSDVGAIVIKFDPFSVPDGIVAIFDGLEYNALSSPYYGFLQGLPTSAPTFIGVTGSSCPIIDVGGSGIFNEYAYDGTSFILTGNTVPVTTLASQAQLTTGGPGLCVMVVPKTTPSPSVINIKVYGLCGGTGWNIDVNCPVMLTQYFRSQGSTGTLECPSPIDQPLYVVPVTGIAPVLGQYDWVFSDPYGQNVLPDGWYFGQPSIMPGINDAFHVTDGVIDSFTNFCG